MKTKQLFVFIFIVFNLYVLETAKAQISIENIKKGNYGTPEQRAMELNQAMINGLHLDALQAEKVKAINWHYALRTEREIVQQPLSTWQKYWRLYDIQSDKDKELKNILTKEQFSKYVKKKNQVISDGFKSFFGF